MRTDNQKKPSYQRAFEIDKEISALAEKYLITKENALEWLRFTRTIKSSLDIIEEKAIEILRK